MATPFEQENKNPNLHNILHGDMNNPDAFLDQRCHYTHTPMPNRVEKGERTGKCCGENRLYLKTLLFSPANIENPVKIAA